MQRWNFWRPSRAIFIPVLLEFAAGQAPNRTPEQIKAAYEAHKNEFDFLLGDWQITVHTARGTRHGFWSVVKLEDGQILDEYRLVTDKGETSTLITSARNYNAVSGQWELVNMNGQNGLWETGTAHLVGNEMHLEQKVDQMNPTVIRRVRYYDIRADHFLWKADVSPDRGGSWTLGVTQIEAKRIGPPRTIVLTSASGPTGTSNAK